LYKITHTLSRQKNYDKILAMFNDTMQGRAEYLGIFIGGTPEFLEDRRRGLYSDEALRSRLAISRSVKSEVQDTSAPVVRVETLTYEEITKLLQRLTEVHAVHYQYEKTLTKSELKEFLQEVTNRLGSEKLLTPREVVRDFLTVLNILQQNPEMTFSQLINGSGFKPTNPGQNSTEAAFTL